MKKLDIKLARLDRLISTSQKNLESTMNRRLGIGLGIFVLIMISASLPQYKLLSLLVPLASIPFIVLFVKTRRLRQYLNQLKLWQALLQRQRQRMSGIYSQEFLGQWLDSYNVDTRTRAKDLHLAGEASLFAQMDETLTEGGRKELLKWILNPELSRAEINERQNLLKELSRKHWPLIKLKIQSDSHQQKLATQSLVADLKQSMTGPQFTVYWIGHLVLYPLTWIFTIAASFGKVPVNPALPFTLYFLFFIISKGQILDSFQRTEGMSVHLDKLKKLFIFVESHFTSPILKSSLPKIAETKPSKGLISLSRYSAALSVVAHPLVYLFVNIIFPWDYLFTNLAETWRKNWAEQFPTLLEELHHFEILLSGALFYKFQTSTLPTLSESHELHLKEILHPLIDRDQVVRNSWTLPAKKNLILITGSNMSGKSTFLRTFGLNHQLAQMGAPVYAEKMTTPHAPLFTCLQVADSLEAGYSTFYYEVKQISQMIHRAQKGESFIFLIDEIFRGTNNRERLIGSQTVIKELIAAPNALGIITTHDLELTQLEKEFRSLTNWHFKDDVDNNQLTFSYKIQEGACPTTNALKIMANEGLPVPLR